MKCKKALKLIPLYSELGQAEKEKLEKHFEECKFCAKEFEAYTSYLNLIRGTLNFEEPKDYWESYRLTLTGSRIKRRLWRSWWEKVSGFSYFLRTPVLGPVPAYVFSFALIVFLAFGFYPSLGKQKAPSTFTDNLVISEGELYSATDEGGMTIYKVRNR